MRFLLAWVETGTVWAHSEWHDLIDCPFRHKRFHNSIYQVTYTVLQTQVRATQIHFFIRKELEKMVRVDDYRDHPNPDRSWRTLAIFFVASIRF